MAPSTGQADRRNHPAASATPPQDDSRCSCDRATASHVCDIHPERAPGVSSSADLPPSTLLRNRNGSSGKAEGNKWKTVRPWKPPASEDQAEGGSGTSTPSTAMTNSFRAGHEAEEDTLSLEVIDVSSTAIALGIFGLQTYSGSDEASAPAISIRLNQAPWPHVFHSPSSSEEDGEDIRETVVVFGLEPGHEYEVELAVVGGRGSAGLPFTTPAATHDASVDAEMDPEDAPPPYTPSPMPASAPSPSTSASETTPSSPVASTAPPPTEASVKAQIKKLRATAKASETSLQGSIHSLQRALERTAREDQRTRQRLIALDDGARKLRDAAAQDAIEADEALAELPDIEREANERQTQVATRKAEVQQREKEVLEQTRHDDETLASLQRQVEALKERAEGVRAESERYEREVLEDLTARLAHLDQQLESGEISPSFLSALATGLPGARILPAGLAKGVSSGSIARRERKVSSAPPGKAATATASGSKTTTPPTTAALPRIVPGWKKPEDKSTTSSANNSAPTSVAAATPSPPASSPQHDVAAVTAPAMSDEQVAAPEKSAWRGAWGAVGETWARAAQRGNAES